MIKAIIFDCFGVLCLDAWQPLKQQYFGHDADLFEEAGSLNHQVDAGLLDYSTFIQRISQMAQVNPVDVRQRIETSPPNEPLFHYISNKLKPDYKIGMLSNAGANWLPDLFTEDQISVFDEVVLSYETSFIKPHPEAYQAAASKLGLMPDECIFIDDQPGNVTGAEDAGMVGLQFETTNQIINDLNILLNIKH